MSNTPLDYDGETPCTSVLEARTGLLILCTESYSVTCLGHTKGPIRSLRLLYGMFNTLFLILDVTYDCVELFLLF